ncbi:GIY-YIG nuclease family protein [Ruminococcus sp.]|uniref:GIY-YIG nuclease family protein n=1 Tax=Ruminococcus sp. TaxID=41978 RepID=UPI002E7A8065|nr:GIY-YIG nuclease family protein [Ruminococcus sp.]MEE1262914.1 GIY-YIG nuclease family protein [Ruminococcus sp.]
MKTENQNKNYTYILKCSDGSLYCGWTNDLEKRLSAHNAGTASKYTRTRRPVELIYFEEFQTKQEAMSREFRIKKLTRAEKLRLTEGFSQR